jgi:hypothetical protein
LLAIAGREPADLVREVAEATPELTGTWRPVATAFAELVRRRRG